MVRSERRAGARRRPRSDQYFGFLLGATTGAVLESQSGRPRQCRRRHHNSIKQAAEFGIVRGGQKLAGLLVFINDVNSLGLEVAQGMLLTNAFYWDRNDEVAGLGAALFPAHEQMPNMTQAGIYSSTMHYLKAVAAAGTDETNAVMDKMRCNPDQRLLREEWDRSAKTAGWFTTCIYTRSRSRRNPRARGTTTSSLLNSGGSGVSAAVGIQMPAGEESAVGVVEGYDLSTTRCAAAREHRDPRADLPPLSARSSKTSRKP